ncbi:hypothetical protein BOTBODRAFT_505684 [Botryobasidium botryosum FD-172 SS1]|uniref:protein kinase C n=1 Tax=Botryobasidium botryosum (strain FD-172 SS1) TaxID=930990 RepID=A0A067M2X0_BOTB1|nr:hypothetical protein BOTBODRAFT_505684 [Botryobasidium botryosum FD-172 SS1]
MQVQDLDQKIQDVYKRIQKETIIIQRAEALTGLTKNQDVLRSADLEIRQSKRNLSYFEDTLKELQARKMQAQRSPPRPTDPRAIERIGSPHQEIPSPSPSGRGWGDRDRALPQPPPSAGFDHGQPRQQGGLYPPGSAADPRGSLYVPEHRPKPYTNLDLIKADTPYTTAKISRVLQQLEFKLQVELQYKKAIEQMAKLYKADGDKRSRADTEIKRIESDKKIHLLQSALKKYKTLHILDEDVEEEAPETPVGGERKDNLRKAVSGKLQISIKEARDLDHAPLAKRSSKIPNETSVVLKVEGTTRAQSHPSRTDRWNEDVEVTVDKASEVEIAVYDKQGNEQPVPIGYLWIKIADIVEAQRRQRVENESVAGGWVTAAGAMRAPSDPTAQGFGDFDRPGGPAGGAAGGASGPPNTSAPEGLFAWFVVEPAGALGLHVNFIKENVRKRNIDAGGLGRRSAVRMRKGEVHEMNGHKFIFRQFYQIILCAFCNEFLLKGSGYQCEDCRYTCHKECYPKVVTKCISKSNAETDADEDKINHRIPHRFETFAIRRPVWCCHCGSMLPLGKKNGVKCTECDVTCHQTCAHLVPDFCGMSMETANQLLSKIHDIKSHQKHKPSNLSQSSSSRPLPSPTSSMPYSPKPQMEQIEGGFDRMGLHPDAPPGAGPGGGAGAHGPGSRYSDVPPMSPKPGMYGDPRFDAAAPQSYPPPGQRPGSGHGGPGGGPAYADHPLPAPPTQPSRHDSYPLPLGAQPPRADGSNYSPKPSPPSLPPHMAPPAPERSSSVPRPGGPPQQLSHGSQHGRKRKVGLEDFNFLAVLGKGNFGKVMLAEEKKTTGLYAIKVLKKEFIIENDEVESTRSEKRVFLAAARERHPFLLGLHSCFQTETRIYFVMEYVSGGDLMLHIQRKQFSLRQAKFYAAEVLLALEYFHANGIIYRDLKLDNILLTLDGHVKVADYGLCKEEMWYGKTTSTFCGTPEFMAPEILLEQRYGRAVDWWAFGVLTYEMLLGQSPFRGDDEDEIFDAILEDEPLYPITMPRDAVSILQKLLTRDPARRLGSGEGDAEEIKRHPFFKDTNFDDVLNKRIPPPYYPTIANPADVSNFDSEFTREQPTLTPVHGQLSSKDQAEFNGFSWVATWADI